MDAASADGSKAEKLYFRGTRNLEPRAPAKPFSKRELELVAGLKTTDSVAGIHCASKELTKCTSRSNLHATPSCCPSSPSRPPSRHYSHSSVVSPCPCPCPRRAKDSAANQATWPNKKRVLENKKRAANPNPSQPQFGHVQLNFRYVNCIICRAYE